MTNCSVIGAGRWGAFQAWHISTHKNFNVLLYDLDTPYFKELQETKKNNLLTLPNNVSYTTDLQKTLQNEYIIVAISAQNYKDLVEQINKLNVKDKTFILAMKGIDLTTKKRLSEISPKNNKCAVLLGPGHVQDYTKGIYNCAVVDSSDKKVKKKVAELLQSDIMKVFYGNDLIGNEIGAAYKNVIGIVAGMLDGLGWQSVKGALMSRAVLEVGRFIKYCGGKEKTAMGLALLGDFEATLFSPHSNNRGYGESFVKGTADLTKNCEGYYTLKAVYEIGKKAGLNLPITYRLYDIIYKSVENNKNINFREIAEKGMRNLFGEGLENEF